MPTCRSFHGESRDAFRRGFPFDDATWAQGRGWALWKALITLARDKEDRAGADAATRRFGWRCTAREVIDNVVADHLHSA
jgi:hypothetical protein